MHTMGPFKTGYDSAVLALNSIKGVIVFVLIIRWLL